MGKSSNEGKSSMGESRRMKMAVTTPDLPQELIISNILIRLPYKSLCRFRCVSKLWDDTICDPNFLASHYAQAKKNLQLTLCVLFKYRHRNFFLIISNGLVKSIYRSTEYVCFVDICNGLFCFRSNSEFEIYNPSTGEFLSYHFPKPELGPRSRFMSVGFGYDPIRNEYKVVLIVEGKKCYIYTLGTHFWRDITLASNIVKCFKGLQHFADKGLSSNGAVNWIINMVSSTWLVVSFDVHHEKFLVVFAPQPTDSVLHSGTVFDKQLRLNLLYYEKEDKVEVCSLENPQESLWVVTPLVIVPPRAHFPSHQIVLFLQGEGIYYCFNYGGRMILFHPGVKKIIRKAVLPSVPNGYKLIVSTFYNVVENNLWLKTFMRPSVSGPTNYTRCGKWLVQPERIEEWNFLVEEMDGVAGIRLNQGFGIFMTGFTTSNRKD